MASVRLGMASVRLGWASVRLGTSGPSYVIGWVHRRDYVLADINISLLLIRQALCVRHLMGQTAEAVLLMYFS